MALADISLENIIRMSKVFILFMFVIDYLFDLISNPNGNNGYHCDIVTVNITTTATMLTMILCRFGLLLLLVLLLILLYSGLVALKQRIQFVLSPLKWVVVCMYECSMSAHVLMCCNKISVLTLNMQLFVEFHVNHALV